MDQRELEEMGVAAAPADVTVALTVGAVALALLIHLTISSICGDTKGTTDPSLAVGNRGAATLVESSSPSLREGGDRSERREGESDRGRSDSKPSVPTFSVQDASAIRRVLESAEVGR